MKIKFEVDVTPEELLELFEGNTETVQKAFIQLFMRQMSGAAVPENAVVEFWKSVLDKNTTLFEQYQNAMSGGSSAKK